MASTASTSTTPSTAADTAARNPSTTVIAHQSSSKTPRILACVLCQHRKIKCDRNFPCANCIKANVTCTPSTPAPARKRRRPNQDLQERLARCEELLKEYATAKPAAPPSPKPRPDEVPELAEPYPQWKPAGKLVVEDGGVRFMDSFLLGTVYDELRSMRKIVDDEYASCDEPTPTTDENSPDENSELIFGGESPGGNVEDLTPNPSHIFRLWQIFLDRCNPLTKIIHIPTLQPYLVEATGTNPQLPKNVEALLFSIYTLATVSMTNQECEDMLGSTREKALAQFSNGVRLCLMRMSFLKTHDLLTLQALVIYLISLQGRYNRHAAWILNGIVIRIAQKMGLHRDGELLGLTPFETEMRRRLWWQIIMVDAKYAMLSGLSHALLPRSWDTKEPRNINDADLLPSATEPFQDKEGPTEMIFVLVTYKVAKILVKRPGLETIIMLNEFEAIKGPNAVDKRLVEEFMDVVQELENALQDVLDRFSSPTAGELHIMAHEFKEHIIGKMRQLIAPPTESSDWGSEVFDHTSNAFKLSVLSTEHAIQQYKTMSHPGWDWFVRLHFQLDIFFYLVGQLCHRTTGRLVDKAWQIVEDVYMYHPEFLNTSEKMYRALAVFVLRAWKKREEELCTRLGRLPDTPLCVQKLRLTLPGLEDLKMERTPSEFSFATRPPDVNGGADASSFDQFMGNYIDFNTVDFDMWANPVPNASSQIPASFLFNGYGPQPQW